MYKYVDGSDDKGYFPCRYLYDSVPDSTCSKINFKFCLSRG